MESSFHSQMLPPPAPTPTVWLPASARRSARAWGTIHERWHYRSCEDPLKALLGLLCGGQPDLRGSSCLEVKLPLVLAWGGVGGSGVQHAKLLA